MTTKLPLAVKTDSFIKALPVSNNLLCLIHLTTEFENLEQVKLIETERQRYAGKSK